MRLYSDFYQSDIIVASPLGLATRLGEAPAEGDDEPSSSGPADFLSSIEVAVVTRADVMTMQNWAHVKLGAMAALRSATFVDTCRMTPAQNLPVLSNNLTHGQQPALHV